MAKKVAVKTVSLRDRFKRARKSLVVSGDTQPTFVENTERAEQGEPIITVGDDGEAEEWVAPVPEDLPEDIQNAHEQAISTREVTEADVDRLWDWIRTDEDKGARFLGSACATSAHMRQRLTVYLQMGTLVAVDDAASGVPMHIGFASVHPTSELTAAVHLYLQPAIRGRLTQVGPPLLREAQEAAAGKTLMVVVDTAVEARAYQHLGFELRYMLKLPPPQA
jgi:hypothetical protein